MMSKWRVRKGSIRMVPHVQRDVTQVRAPQIQLPEDPRV
jgi:hypothetical protein